MELLGRCLGLCSTFSLVTAEFLCILEDRTRTSQDDRPAYVATMSSMSSKHTFRTPRSLHAFHFDKIRSPVPRAYPKVHYHVVKQLHSFSGSRAVRWTSKSTHQGYALPYLLLS